MTFFIYEVVKHDIKRNINYNLIHNVNKKSSPQKSKVKGFNGVHDSRNLWGISIGDSIHITLVDCVGASGHAIPFMYDVPGEIFNRNITEDCTMCVSVIPIAYKGCIKSRLLIQRFFCLKSNIPSEFK